MTGKNPAPCKHRFSHFREDIIEALADNKYYKFGWKCLPDFLADTIIKSTFNEQQDRIPLEAYLANIKLALNMVLAESIPNTHPLFLKELCEIIKINGEAVFTEFGRKAKIEERSVGENICLSLSQNGGTPVLDVEISKKRQGHEDRNSVAKYLETAKEKAIAKADRNLFYQYEGEIKTSEVLIRLSSRLPDTVTHKLLKDLANNINDVRALLELR